MRDPVRDEELAGLLDGTLEPERASKLRERVRQDARLAERLEALRRIDATLRSIPEPPVPSDWLARVKARARQAEGGGPAEQVARASGRARSRASSGTRPGPPRRALRRGGLAWAFATGTAAAAAGLALALWLGTGSPTPDPEPPLVVARPDLPPASQATPASPPPSPSQTGPVPAPPRREPGSPQETLDLEAVSAEEIALVRTFAALGPEELEIVEQLDLLERWDPASRPRRGS